MAGYFDKETSSGELWLFTVLAPVPSDWFNPTEWLNDPIVSETLAHFSIPVSSSHMGDHFWFVAFVQGDGPQLRKMFNLQANQYRILANDQAPLVALDHGVFQVSIGGVFVYEGDDVRVREDIVARRDEFATYVAFSHKTDLGDWLEFDKGSSEINELAEDFFGINVGGQL